MSFSCDAKACNKLFQKAQRTFFSGKAQARDHLKGELHGWRGLHSRPLLIRLLCNAEACLLLLPAGSAPGTGSESSAQGRAASRPFRCAQRASEHPTDAASLPPVPSLSFPLSCLHAPRHSVRFLAAPVLRPCVLRGACARCILFFDALPWMVASLLYPLDVRVYSRTLQCPS